jgi:SAM-dependent methyltransferase
MNFLRYLNYFFYIAINWNFKLALFTVFHEIRGEKNYGLNTSELNNLRRLSIKGNNFKHAEIYQGANYFLIEKLFSYLQSLNVNKNIIDIGCGKGRVLVVAGYYGFNKIIGIDFAAELCEEATKNIILVQSKFPGKSFNVIHADAVDYEIEKDTNVFFFFNPFNHIVMLAVVKNILRSLKINPREVFAVYINPVHKEIFLSAGFEQIFYLQKLKYAEASIFMLDARREMEDNLDV